MPVYIYKIRPWSCKRNHTDGFLYHTVPSRTLWKIQDISQKSTGSKKTTKNYLVCFSLRGFVCSLRTFINSISCQWYPMWCPTPWEWKLKYFRLDPCGIPAPFLLTPLWAHRDTARAALVSGVTFRVLCVFPPII